MESKNSCIQLLVLSQLFYPEMVSTGQTLTELCEELSELGVQLEVICGPPTVVDQKARFPKYLVHKNIRIKRVWGTRFPKLRFFGKLLNQISFTLSVLFYLLINSERKPILVITNPPFLGLLCAIQKAFKKNKYIYLVFDVYPDTAIQLGVLKERSVLVKVWNQFNRLTLRHASSVVVLGRCMQKVILNKEDNPGKLAKKTNVIHIWCDDRRIRPVEKGINPYVDKWNLKGKFVVGYSGNMGRFHDVETIMEAARELQNEHDIHFLFIGEGYKKKWMRDFAEKWNLNNCQFHLYVPRSEFQYSLACADIGLVSLVKGQEGLSVPSKAFGIMAASVPLIGIMSAESEVALVIKENNCGFVVAPGEVNGLVHSITELHSNEDLRIQMGKNARTAIDEKYNLKSAALKYKALIDALQ